MLLQIFDEYRNEDSTIGSSVIYVQKALDLSDKIGNKQLRLMTNMRIAGLYNLTGNYPEALQLSLKNLKNSEQMRDSNKIFFAKREIMWAHHHTGNSVRTLEMAKELNALTDLNFFKTSPNWKTYKLIALHNLANNYQDLKQNDSALYYRKLEYTLSKSIEKWTGLALATSSLGELYGILNKLDSAVYYNNLGVYYSGLAKRSDILRGVQLEIASIFLKTKQLDSALFYSRLVFNEAKKISDTSDVMRASLQTSEIFRDRGQFDSAYNYLSLFHDLKDRSLEDEKKEQIQNISFNEMMRQKQLEQERKLGQLEYSSRIRIYLLVAGLSVAMLIAFLLYRNNRQKQKAKQNIEKAYEELKATQRQLIQSEKMASLGELTAGIAHEIQNPLNFVNNFSEVNRELIEEFKSLRKESFGQKSKLKIEEQEEILNDIDTNLEKISLHGKRADAIVKGMLQHSRTSSGQKELTDINTLCDEYLRLAYHGLRAKDKSFNAEIKTNFDEGVGKINLVPQDIGRVILNLINNAFHAVNEKAKRAAPGYEPTVIVGTRRLQDRIEISVKDNGNGIPASIREKIFQPFFTTKPTGQGTGLGLSLAYDIVKAHGGEINVETKEGEGSEFVIQLPVTSIFP